MTTRSYTKSTSPYYINWYSTGLDGKYEEVGGVTRLKFNNYEAQKHEEFRTKSTTSNYCSCSCSLPSHSNVFTSNDDLRVQSRLVSQVRGHDFNLAVAVAEGKQTVNMVVSALQTVGNVALDLKRGRFESAARRLGVKPRPSKLDHRDLAGRWLELQYGWFPLISDVFEAAEAYSVLTQKPRKQQIKVNLRKNGLVSTSCSPSNWAHDAKYHAVQSIIYELTESLSEARSLGLTNPAYVAWEKIPYSFVVDWFIPIGTYLDNLNTIPTLTGRTITTKFVKYSTDSFSVKNKLYYDGATTRNNGLSMKRVVSNGLTTATPRFVNLPEAMSPTRVWNAIALAAQRFR